MVLWFCMRTASSDFDIDTIHEIFFECKNNLKEEDDEDIIGIMDFFVRVINVWCRETGKMIGVGVLLKTWSTWKFIAFFIYERIKFYKNNLRKERDFGCLDVLIKIPNCMIMISNKKKKLLKDQWRGLRKIMKRYVNGDDRNLV